MSEAHGPITPHQLPALQTAREGAGRPPRRQALLEESAQTPRGAVHIAQTRAWLLVAQQLCPVGAARLTIRTSAAGPLPGAVLSIKGRSNPLGLKPVSCRTGRKLQQIAADTQMAQNPQAGHLLAPFGVTGTDVGRPDAHTWEEAGVGEACVKGTSC